MNPMLEARAFRIWRFAAPLKWDCTHVEIASATGMTLSQVKHTIAAKGWGYRIHKWRHSEEATVTSRATISGRAAYHRSRGHRVDENEIDLLQLMGV